MFAVGAGMEIPLGILLGAVVAMSLYATTRFLASPRTVLSEEGRAMQAALHAASSTLPHLRRGLDAQTAQKAAPHLRALTQAAMLAIADRDTLLALEGARHSRLRPGAPVEALFNPGPDDRVHVEPRIDLQAQGIGAAVVAPLVVRGDRIGSLAAFYASERRIKPEETRTVQEAASLVSAQVELASISEQEERLAQAELSALRAQISPHFVYNALSAVASHVHSRPDEARELLTEFAEFIRYAFARDRSFVTVADELRYVEKYLRLERARFGERLEVRLEVPPDILPVVIPVLSLQPLVENSIRHGVEAGSGGRVEIVGDDLGADARIQVVDDGCGMEPTMARAALAGLNGGIGISNVHRRLQSMFGPAYGLTIDSKPDAGTTVALTVPKSHPGVRAA
jgi:two-component system LytT family sensor kinase